MQDVLKVLLLDIWPVDLMKGGMLGLNVLFVLSSIILTLNKESLIEKAHSCWQT